MFPRNVGVFLCKYMVAVHHSKAALPIGTAVRASDPSFYVLIGFDCEQGRRAKFRIS
jgi:hypothetical protein